MSRIKNIDLHFHQSQMDFLYNRAVYRAMAGGIGSGKSYVGSYDMLKRAIAGRLYMVTAPTYPMLRDSSWRSFIDHCRNLELLRDHRQVNLSTMTVRLPHGCEVLFRSADEPERLRGPNLSGVWMDEASLQAEDAYKIIIGRLRQAGEQGWLSATFTPKGKQHWTFEVFGKGRTDTAMFHCRTGDNPFLPPDFESRLREQYPSEFARQELGGEFLDASGILFNPYKWPRYVNLGDAWSLPHGLSRTVHLHTHCTVFVAVDWAVSENDTADQTAFVVFALTRDEPRRLMVVDAIAKRFRVEERAARLADVCKQYRPYLVAGEDDVLNKSILPELWRQPAIPEMRCLPIAGKGKKERSMPAQLWGENGRIYLPSEAPWLDHYMAQLSSFTGSGDGPDDLVDCTGIAARIAEQLRGSTGKVEHVPEVFIQGRRGF